MYSPRRHIWSLGVLLSLARLNCRFRSRANPDLPFFSFPAQIVRLRFCFRDRARLWFVVNAGFVSFEDSFSFLFALHSPRMSSPVQPSELDVAALIRALDDIEAADEAAHAGAPPPAGGGGPFDGLRSALSRGVLFRGVGSVTGVPEAPPALVASGEHRDLGTRSRL